MNQLKKAWLIGIVCFVAFMWVLGWVEKPAEQWFNGSSGRYYDTEGYYGFPLWYFAINMLALLFSVYIARLSAGMSVHYLPRAMLAIIVFGILEYIQLVLFDGKTGLLLSITNFVYNIISVVIIFSFHPHIYNMFIGYYWKKWFVKVD